MKGQRFASIKEIKTTSLEELMAISKSDSKKFFKNAKAAGLHEFGIQGVLV